MPSFRELFEAKPIRIKTPDGKIVEIKRDSGMAALLATKMIKQPPTSRQRFRGWTGDDLRRERRMVKTQKTRYMSRTALDLDPRLTPMTTQKNEYAPTGGYDLRPDIKPRPITYRQMFK